MKTPAILHAFQNQILPADAQLLQADDPVEIGGHRLAGRLLSSGAGVVYLARDRAGGLVTVKTTHTGTADPGPVRARLRTEATCVRRLPASTTARLLHDGTDRTPPYLVSEYVKGPSLERVIDVEGPLPSPMVGALAAALAETLAAVHEAGVVHGNLTPAHVLLTKDGLRITDFGVAEEISTTGEPAVADNPGWLAPELLTGGPPAPACDIFGWGCLVTYAATGHSPHGATPSDADALEQPVRGLVDAAVAEDPAARPTATELTAKLTAKLPARLADAPPAAERVEEYTAPAVRRRRRIRPRTAVLAALVAVGALFFAVPTANQHRFAAPHSPRTSGPVTPPGKAPPTKRTSNAAAMSAYDAPPVTRRADRTPAPKATPSESSPGKLWMSCSTSRPSWCSLSGTPPPAPHGWQFSWSPGG